MYSCHLFLISSASVSSIPFQSFILSIFAWKTPFISLIFLKRSVVFPSLLFSSISLHWSQRKAFLSLLAFFGTLHSYEYIFHFLHFLYLLFFSQVFVRPPQTAILPFLHPMTPANSGDLDSVPLLGRSPGKRIATHSNILAWRKPWTEEPGRLQSVGLQRVG